MKQILLTLTFLTLSLTCLAKEKSADLKREPNSMRIERYCFTNGNSEGFKESCYSSAKLCEERKRFWSDVKNLGTQDLELSGNNPSDLYIFHGGKMKTLTFLILLTCQL